MVQQELDCDVAIVGAGPAGSSAAAFLRLKGVSVTVLEREEFPRFHIGESLLTMSIPALARMGVRLEGASFANLKPGALFMQESSREQLRVDFSHGLPGTFPHAFQVERAEFDAALARRAGELGASLRFGCAVRSWEEREEDVVLKGDFGELRAKVAIDATGQDALFGRRQRTVEALDRFGRCASFSTFAPVRSETARRCVGNGDILILLVDAGWMWLIPLTQGRVSVGIVERNPKPGLSAEDVLGSTLRDSRFLSDFFAGAEPIQPYRRIANYSYYNARPASRRCLTVGDASAFLDPIFSSGVTVAITTAERLAEAVASAIASGTEPDLSDYREQCRKAYTTFDRLIERFYRPEWVRTVFFSAGKEDRMLREFTAILAGDVWRDDNDVQRMLLGSANRSLTSSA